ncbi:cytochrome C assembly family protein [Galenea microaerophila]
MPLFFAALASLLYLYGFARLWRAVTHPGKTLSTQVLNWTIGGALLCHTLALGQTLWVNHQLDLQLSNILSAIAWLSVALLLLLNRKQPVFILGLFIFPLSSLFTLTPLFLDEPYLLPLNIGIHIVLSVGAYSLLTLATAQAILYSIQERRFRQKKVGAILNILPPLQVMEKLLIQLVISGFILLTLALLSGLFFVQDMFAQHLIHKTFFAILAWLVYAFFLSGHFHRGWRGQKAAKFILWAYVFLSLSYIGTQMIILAIYG